MSGIYDATLAAGAAQNFAVLGSLVKVTSAPQGVVQIKLDGGEAYVLMEGQGVRFLHGRQFRDVAAKNLAGSQQAISLFIGGDELIDTRISGIVSITNKIGSNITQLEGNASLALGLQTVQVVAPASNPKGLLVRVAGVGVTGSAGGVGDVRLVAAPVVPASTVPSNGYNMAGAAIAGAGSKSDTHADQNYLLPAGWGVWAVSNHSAVAPTAATYQFYYEPL